MTMPPLTQLLADQLEWHWTHQLRPRLDGLTDDEYLWEPVGGMWSVRPEGVGTAPIQGGTGAARIEFAFPEPDPAPVTTIAWRLGHLTVGVFGVRAHHHFGAPADDYMSHDYPLRADAALAQLDDAYRLWTDGVASLDEAALAQPIGAAEGPWADRSMAELIVHISREAIHHGAEIALLRDLYRCRGDLGAGDRRPRG